MSEIALRSWRVAATHRALPEPCWAPVLGLASQVAPVVKDHLLSRRCKRSELDPWVGKIPWRRAQQPTPGFLPGGSTWTEEPGGLQSMGSQRGRHDWDLARAGSGPRVTGSLGQRTQRWTWLRFLGPTLLSDCHSHSRLTAGLHHLD